MLDDLIQPEHLKARAGDIAFKRGEVYFQDGRVEILAEGVDEVTGTVEGGEAYRVRLRSEGKSLQGECSCPMGLRGEFCKHLVALALERLSEEAETPHPQQRPDAKRRSKEDELRVFLESQDKARLLEWLMEAALWDRGLRDKLLMAARAGGKATEIRKLVTQATRVNGFVGYRDMPAYARRVDELIDGLEKLLGRGRGAELINLAEYAIDRLYLALQACDDSDGYMSELLARLRHLHVAASAEASPEPVGLARHLFQRELTDEWEAFIDVLDDYDEILGQTGIAEYERLARAEWDKLPALEPGDSDSNRHSHRFRITRIMEKLALRTGDVEALVSIKSKDLSHSYGFLQIAELYRQAGRTDEAISWAERGLAEFPQAPDSRLEDFLVDGHFQCQRIDDAMKVAWTQFNRKPSAESYKQLMTRALNTDSSCSWSERALDSLRASIADHFEASRKLPWSRTTTQPDHTALVEVFVWEKNPLAALAEAQTGGCRVPGLLKLAGMLGSTHPLESVALYQRCVNPIIEKKNNDAYREAATVIRTVRDLLEAQGREQTFRDWVAEVRQEHKPKRNFIKLLDAL